jgi:hypothetical protein
MRYGLVAFAVVLCPGVLGAGCRRDRPSAPPAAAESDDSIAPVYPVDGLAALPLARRYCDVVREMPARRREACCPGTGGGYAPTAECARTLSAALRSGAVTLDAATSIAARPRSAPPPPDASG